MKKSFKNIIIIIVVTSSFSIGFVNFKRNNNLRDLNLVASAGFPVIPFKVGLPYLPADIDPIIAWGYPAFDVIDQVVEGLFAYDLGDPNLALIPRLASALGTWNASGDEYTIPLRTGVKFHDGTDFNAAAVVAHWDRMAWALNTTGTNTISITQLRELYEFPNRTPIVSNVVDNGDNTVTFFLNGPYVPFEALLAFSGSYIQSPTYITSLSNTYIDTYTGDIVGTGPFVYDSYEVGVDVKFHAFDDYWKGKASIEELVFKEITNTTARSLALLAGDIHFLYDPSESYYGVLNSTAGLTFEEGPQSVILQYLGMNNNLINVTFRKAISYALDYDYSINTLKGGNAVRAKSPIPLGIRYSNATFDAPIFNLTHARLIMQSMGFGMGFNVSDDTEWVNQESTSPFAIFNYSYNIGNTFREGILVLLQNNLSKIGIRVIDDGMTFMELIYRLYEIGIRHRDMLELYWLDWKPLYNDPSHYINNLFTNRSIASNGAQYNGWLSSGNSTVLNDNVQLLMEIALIETDPALREAYYDRIQELLIERDYPWAWVYVDKLYYAYNVNLTGFQPNAYEKLDFYSCQWAFYAPYDYSIVVSHPLDINYEFGSTGNTITWIITADYTFNHSYTVYQNSSFSNTDSWVSGIPVVISVDALPVGFYEYRIEIHNANETAEDIVIVTVESKMEVPVEPGIPGYSLLFISIASLIILSYLHKQIKGKIRFS